MRKDSPLATYRAEGKDVSKKSLYQLVHKYKVSHSIGDRRTWKAPRKISDVHYSSIDESMEANPQMTSRQLLPSVQKQFPDLNVSISTLKRARCELGWVAKKTHLYNGVNLDKQEMELYPVP